MFVNSIKCGDTVKNESAMFVGSDRVKLLYPARRVIRVCNEVTGEVWQENVDWSFDEKNNELIRLAGSRMPFMSIEEMALPDEQAIYYPEPGANSVPGRIGGGNVRFDAGSFFAEHQVEIDYEAAADAVLVPGYGANAGKRLPAFRAKLSAGKNVRITALGDSITEGYNSGKFIGFAPYRKPWVELFAEDIARRFQLQCDLRNRGINGESSDASLRKPELLEGSSDLWIIAYGMNELGRAPQEYIATIREVISKISAADPAAEFLLVTPMSGYDQWEYTPVAKTLAFAQALREFCDAAGENILCADVSSLWQAILQHKSFYDITGNGVNHPNDYSHTIYAAGLAMLFPGR